ncbi:hypothetical protein Taro_021140 [Colocasia esculenta]|uniref:Uncharacterized protein n=1 Tax=Colocasia esculenta TaxID=4460 RepID=A0A843VAM2_COLES|nr:hypothetical protein [Colocasia esculenta]
MRGVLPAIYIDWKELLALRKLPQLRRLLCEGVKTGSGRRLQELDGKLAAINILSWRQHHVPLTPIGDNSFAAKFFRSPPRPSEEGEISLPRSGLPADVDRSPESEKIQQPKEHLPVNVDPQKKPTHCVDTLPGGVDTLRLKLKNVNLSGHVAAWGSRESA